MRFLILINVLVPNSCSITEHDLIQRLNVPICDRTVLINVKTNFSNIVFIFQGKKYIFWDCTLGIVEN